MKIIQSNNHDKNKIRDENFIMFRERKGEREFELIEEEKEEVTGDPERSRERGRTARVRRTYSSTSNV